MFVLHNKTAYSLFSTVIFAYCRFKLENPVSYVKVFMLKVCISVCRRLCCFFSLSISLDFLTCWKDWNLNFQFLDVLQLKNNLILEVHTCQNSFFETILNDLLNENLLYRLTVNDDFCSRFATLAIAEKTVLLSCWILKYSSYWN